MTEAWTGMYLAGLVVDLFRNSRLDLPAAAAGPG